MSEQKPVAWLELRENLPPVVVPRDLGTPVYIQPQLTLQGVLVDVQPDGKETWKVVAQPERTLTDEVIADLWHQNGGFHHHFARAVERYLKGEK